MILRATEITGAAGITDFVLRTVLAASRDIIESNDRIVLSERDALCVLEALDIGHSFLAVITAEWSGPAELPDRLERLTEILSHGPLKAGSPDMNTI